MTLRVYWHGSSRELVEQIETESSSSPTLGSLNPDSGDSASSSSVVASTGAEIIIPEDRRHSGRVALEGPEEVIGVEGADGFLLNTLKNPFTRQLEAAGTAVTEVEWDPDDEGISVLEKNGFSTTIDEDDEDSNDENSNDGSEDVEEEDDDEVAGSDPSLDVGAIGAIGEAKHGLVKFSTGVDGTFASGASKLNLDNSVDGDGSSTTEVPSLDGSPRAFGRCGSPKSMAMFLFPFMFTVADVSGSL